jgi:hypothetical protein
MRVKDRVVSADDLLWSSSVQIRDINLSIIQGKDTYGSRYSNTFEVLVWDSSGNIPLSDSDIGSYMSWYEVRDLINCIREWDGWASHQRNSYLSNVD